MINYLQFYISNMDTYRETKVKNYRFNNIKIFKISLSKKGFTKRSMSCISKWKDQMSHVIHVLNSLKYKYFIIQCHLSNNCIYFYIFYWYFTEKQDKSAQVSPYFLSSCFVFRCGISTPASHSVHMMDRIGTSALTDALITHRDVVM